MDMVLAIIRGFNYRIALMLVAFVLMMANLYLIYFWATTEIYLGVLQRIFYLHVPLAWIGMLSIVLVALSSITYLITGLKKWDDLAYSIAEIGVIFASLVLITGVLWAKPVWGVWWTWDAKLSTTLILWFIFIGYLMIRSYSGKGTQRGARFAAIVAVVGAIDAPIIYMASVWWRTAHPELNLGPFADESEAIGNSKIYYTFLVSMVSFTVFYIFLLTERYSIKRSEGALDELYQISS